MTAEIAINEKLLEVQKPFLEKVSGRRRQSGSEFRMFLFLDILLDFF
jgi:hypothetical protein